MQGRCTPGDQALAQPRHHVGGEFAQGLGVVAEGACTLLDPARNLGTAAFREPSQLGEIGDRHDAGHDRSVHAQCPRIVDEAEIRVGVVEVLGNRAVGTGIELGLEAAQVGQRVFCLRMGFRVGGHFDVEMSAVFGADEGHQLVGVTQVAAACHARRQVAAQCHDAVASQCAVLAQQGADFLAAAAHAGQVRHAGHAVGVAQALHGFRGLAERGAAGTERHRHELRCQSLELAHGAVELGALLVGLGRVELEADRQHGGTHGSRVCADYIALCG